MVKQQGQLEQLGCTNIISKVRTTKSELLVPASSDALLFSSFAMGIPYKLTPDLISISSPYFLKKPL